MKIYYRISDSGYNKIKPHYINNENCIRNFCNVFTSYINDIIVIADNISNSTFKMICKYVPNYNIKMVNVGHGAGTFNIGLDMALRHKDDEIIYFVENDYLHIENSPDIIKEGLMLGASFISLYDHLDKYISPEYGGNPFCHGGAEDTRVYLSKSTHWKITNSTTMTFASTVKVLKETEEIIRRHTNGVHPNDFNMFIELRNKDKLLLTPIPSYATHGETAWLAPLINWEKYGNG